MSDTNRFEYCATSDADSTTAIYSRDVVYPFCDSVAELPLASAVAG